VDDSTAPARIRVGPMRPLKEREHFPGRLLSPESLA